MKRRPFVIGAILVCLGLPLLLVLTDAASFYARTRINGTIVSSGRKREYLVYVPRSYDRARPTPLVISMHGAMNWPSFQMDLSQWNTVAEENGLILVFPAGTGAGPKTCS